jgi:pimeloyl-ACP methyl ester carboxylesterase
MQSCSQHGYVAALRSHHRLILVDARGHGGSDEPHDAAAYELNLHVGDIVAVLDALDVRVADFWGYSMGDGSGSASRSMGLAGRRDSSSVERIRTDGR